MSGDDEDDMPDDIRAAYEVFLQVKVSPIIRLTFSS